MILHCDIIVTRIPTEYNTVNHNRLYDKNSLVLGNIIIRISRVKNPWLKRLYVLYRISGDKSAKYIIIYILCNIINELYTEHQPAVFSTTGISICMNFLTPTARRFPDVTNETLYNNINPSECAPYRLA